MTAEITTTYPNLVLFVLSAQVTYQLLGALFFSCVIVALVKDWMKK